METKKERYIGEVFVVDEINYVVVESTTSDCTGCALKRHANCRSYSRACMSFNRTDRKDTIVKEVKNG